MDGIRLVVLVALLGLVLLLILLLPWASTPLSGAYATDLPTAAKPAAPAWANSKAPGGPPLRSTGGPDDFGYSYVDSDERPCGPTFNWEDISTTGITLTDITPDYVDVGPLNDAYWITTTGFTFNFYGTDYITVAVSTDGYLNFDNGTADFDPIYGSNQCPIPDVSPPNNAIYGFWDDFDLSDAGEIYVETKGTAPHRRFIVQYHDVPFAVDSDVTVRFQVILFEGSNDILMQYEDVEDPDDPERASGWTATEGLEGPLTTNTGLQYEDCGALGPYNLHNGLAVLYSVPLVVNDTGDAPDANPGDGVCDTTGTGICTLRAAIEEANAISGTNTINFGIDATSDPGCDATGVCSIMLGSALPVITDTVTINGYTQTDAEPATASDDAVLKIVLDGSNAGNGVNGLVLATDDSAICGLNIHGFRVTDATSDPPDFTQGNGIVVREGMTSTIAGNFIGTNVTGTACVGNGGSGVLIGGFDSTADAINNTVGGTDPADRNLITCNGFDPTDSVATGGDGVTIRANYEIALGYLSVLTNTVVGNYIGTDVTGAMTLTAGAQTFTYDSQTVVITYTGNTGNGVRIAGGSSNTVGGTADGERNILSGNELAGVRIEAVAFDESATFTSVAISNTVQGNYIGTDRTGTVALGNLDAGVYIAGLVDNADNNVIGGTTAAARNVIAGNGGSGVMILGGEADNNTVQGNYIGTDFDGDTAIPNDAGGINITDAMTNTIGGTTDTARNLISGNGGYGISIVNAPEFWDPDLEVFGGTGEASGNTIQGNYIGTVVTGTTVLSNTLSGVLIMDAADNLVSENLISGNGANGVLIMNAYPPGNTETDVVTAEGFFTGNPSILFSDSDSATVTITDPPGALQVTKTVIPTTVATPGDSVTFTIRITNTSAVDLTIKRLSDPLHGNLNGQGSCAVPQTLASGNFYTCTFSAPVYDLGGNNTETDVVTASGTDANGNFVIGSDSATVNIGSLPAIRVTKTVSPTSLTSSGATVNFTVTVTNISVTSVTINEMWDSEHGKLIPNGLCPVSQVTLNNFGDEFTCTYSDNVYGATGNKIEGNFIGTDNTGTYTVPNQAAGVAIAAPDNAIEGNVISGNTREGVIIFGANATGNSLRYNLIGTQANGTTALGNGSHGVFLFGNPSDNAIGSSNGVSNTIAYNGGDGVLVLSGTGNQILSNSIFTNTELGIDLGTNGVTANDDTDLDTGANNLQNFPVLTTAYTDTETTIIAATLNSITDTTFTVQFFGNAVCDPSGFGEGGTYLAEATTTTDASGKAIASATVAGDLSGQFVTATATDPYSNTSEFSNCIPVPASPVLTVTKQVQDLNGGDAKPGDILRYTISYENTGNAPATGVFITDTYSIYCITRTNVTDGDFPDHDDDGTSIRWPATGGILLKVQDSGSVGYDCTLPITFTVAGDYDVTNTTTIESDQPTSAQDMVTVTVTAAPVLTITKECTPTTGIIPSDTVGCVIQYTNTGDANATAVLLSDDYDETKGDVPDSSIITSTHFTSFNDNGDTITWDGFVTIPAGESGQVEYDYELFGANAFPDVTTQVTNTVGIDSGDPGVGPVLYTETICIIRFDFNRNGEVDVGDVQAVAARWRMTDADPGWDPRYDVNGDGIITVVDIMMVVAEWGQTCP